MQTDTPAMAQCVAVLQSNLQTPPVHSGYIISCYIMYSKSLLYPPSPRLCTIRLVTQLDWSPCQRVPTEHTSPVNLILKMASSSSISSGNSARTQGRPFFSKGILKWGTEILGKVHLDVTVVPTQCHGTHWNLMFNASNECGWFVQSNG